MPKWLEPHDAHIVLKLAVACRVVYIRIRFNMFSGLAPKRNYNL